MKKDKLLVVIFLLIIFGVCISIPCKYMLSKLGIIYVNRDNFSTYVGKEEVNIIDKINNKIGSIENSIENQITNYFPFYNELNEVYQNVNYYSNSLLYKDIPIKTNSDGEYIFYDKVNEFYYLTNKYTSKELSDRLDKQVSFFNELSNSVDLYIYIPTRYELTNLKKDNLSNYVNSFVSKLNNNIHVSVMDVDSIDTYKKYFYKTDHHWSMYGALQGYRSILDMFGISSYDNLKVFANTERKYYGSLAKSALIDKVNDYILDVDLNLNYTCLVNHNVADELFKPRKIRLDRDYKYYDYYVSYFNGQYGNVLYDYNDEDKENLLILGDSYVWQIDYIIASHFNKTHVINLRYDEYKNNEFNLSQYVRDENISKVLVLYEGGSTIFDQYNYDFEGRVK